MTKPIYEVPLLNPCRQKSKLPSNFERIFNYSDDYIVLWSENSIHILNWEKLTIAASVCNLRGILDIAICGSEIFILEGSRSILRVADTPDIKSNITIFENNLLNLVELPQIEVDEEIIVNAEECFELPPIEHIDLNIPIELGQTEINPYLDSKDVVDYSHKMKQYDKINDIQYDDSILFKSGKNRKHSTDRKTGKSKKRQSYENQGIVEIGKDIGREVCADNEDKVEPNIIVDNSLEVITRPHPMVISFCEKSEIIPDPRSPDTIKKDIEMKEKIIAETLNIEPVIFDDKIDVNIKSPDYIIPNIDFPIANELIRELQSTPIHKKREQTTPTSDDEKLNEFNNLSDDDKKIMIKSEVFPELSYITDHKPQSTSCYYDNAFSPTIPKVTGLPQYMNIPSLWNITIESNVPTASSECYTQLHTNERKSSDPTSDNSDWEIVDA